MSTLTLAPSTAPARERKTPRHSVVQSLAGVESLASSSSSLLSKPILLHGNGRKPMWLPRYLFIGPRGGMLELDGRAFALSGPAIDDGQAVIFARPQDIRITPESNGHPGVTALVRDVNYAGPTVYLELQRADDRSTFQLEIPGTSAVAPQIHPGMTVHVNLKRYQIFVGDKTS